MTPVTSSDRENSWALATASCPVIESATKNVSSGLSVAASPRSSSISSASTCSRPAVSKISVS
jgi:hypothetical protein